MSDISLSSVLSFISFLTTVLTLFRIGAAQFVTNTNNLAQSQNHGSLQFTPPVRFASIGALEKYSAEQDHGQLAPVPLEWQVKKASERFRECSIFPGRRWLIWAFDADGERIFTATSIYAVQQPVSMAKLIMSRHVSARSPGCSSMSHLI